MSKRFPQSRRRRFRVPAPENEEVAGIAHHDLRPDGPPQVSNLKLLSIRKKNLGLFAGLTLDENKSLTCGNSAQMYGVYM